MSKRKPFAKYSPEVREYIQNNYIGCGPKDMAQKLNDLFGTEYTRNQIKGYYARAKLNSGLTGGFVKGQIPHNKGKKGIYYPGTERTQFKSGHLPHNTVPVGTERITRDGYIEIKIKMRPSPNKHDNWISKHRLIWEEANGPIPEGHTIIFKDGNIRNFDLNNLALVSRAELAVLNHRKMLRSNAQLTETSILCAKVILAKNRRKKKERDT